MPTSSRWRTGLAPAEEISAVVADPLPGVAGRGSIDLIPSDSSPRLCVPLRDHLGLHRPEQALGIRSVARKASPSPVEIVGQE